MNISAGGIISKLKKNADWASFLVTALERYPLDRLVDHYTNFGEGGFLWQAAETLKDRQLLKYKLWDSPHLYTTAFKYSLIARLLAEIGIVPSKYKKLTEKIMKGAGAAALTLGGSGPPSSSGNKNYSSSGNSETWRYQS